MSKFYKLTKSNESSTFLILEELKVIRKDLKNTQDNFNSLVSSLYINIAGIILSTILSFIIDSNDSIPLISKLPVIIRFSIIYIALCLIIVFVFNKSNKIFKKFSKLLSKNKIDTLDGRADLKDIFYSKILNDIAMGFSLKDKSEECSDDLSKLYLYESFYYFEKSYRDISANKIIKIYDETNISYTKLLEEINPIFMENLFSLCKDYLEYIKAQSILYDDKILESKTKNLIREYEGFKDDIKKQKRCIDK